MNPANPRINKKVKLKNKNKSVRFNLYDIKKNIGLIFYYLL